MKLVFFAMAVHLNGKQFEITRDLFKALDKDGDGKITVAEFTRQIMRAKKLDDDQSEDYSNFLFRIYDMDGNGCLEFPEFLQIHACITFGVDPTAIYIKQLFKALDKENKKYVSVEDIKWFCRIFKSMDESKADSLIKMLDSNKDGKINYSEFIINYYQFKKFENGN